MRKWTVVASALVFAAGAVAWAPQAEARRGWGIGAGILAAAVIGGVIAVSAYRRPAYAYYPRRVYYAPRYVYRPVYRYRPVYATRTVYAYRPVRYYAPRRVYRVRRW